MSPSSLTDSPRARRMCCSGDLEVLRWSEPTVEMNLAVDEHLAQSAARSGKRIVRLWWGSDPTVVLGRGDKADLAADIEECERRRVGMVKRVTGGGAVLQTPGVLNYSYTAPDYGRMDMDRVFRQGADLVIYALAQFGVGAHQRGVSDVAVGDLKISGSAQARKWKATLLHGTLMVDMDRELMEAVLSHPCKEPDYRRGRAHGEFVVTLRDLGVAADESLLENAFASAAVEVFGQERTERCGMADGASAEDATHRSVYQGLTWVLGAW